MPTQLGTIRGNVHGGRQPVVGSHVYVFAAATLAYGGSGLPASVSNRSTSLLKSVSTGTYPTAYDSTLGAYFVTTDSTGSFSITGEYTCTSGQQVYLYALGGDTGSGSPNTAAGFLAVLGQCPDTGTLSAAVPYITVNEVSTVAAAYAFAGYATDPTHIADDEAQPGSATSVQAARGMANAFANAANLVDTENGTALTINPQNTASVTRQTINALANSLAACVNSTGANSAPCKAILQSAPLNGDPTVVDPTNIPTDTAAAAINIAHFPAAAPDVIFAQAVPASPFQPALTKAPDAWLVFLLFAPLGEPYILAIDNTGNTWTSGFSDAPLFKLSPAGVSIFPDGADPYKTGYGPVAMAFDPDGYLWSVNPDQTLNKVAPDGTLVPGAVYTGGGIATSNVNHMSIDPSGNIWIANNDSYNGTMNQYGNYGSISKFSSGGTALSPGTGIIDNSISHPYNIANDPLGNAWVTTPINVVKLANDGSILSGATGFRGGGVNGASGIAIDASSNVWIANNSGNSLTELDNLGVPLSGSNGFTGGGLAHPFELAIDGAGSVFVESYPATSTAPNIIISRFSNLGVSTLGTGYLYSGELGSTMAVDGSGNLWISGAYEGYGALEIIGLAAPVITPIATGVKTNKLGTRP